MPATTANTSPIYGGASDLKLGGALIGTSANTATDGTGVNTFLIYTAPAVDGAFVYSVLLKPVASTAATVARLWYCSATGAYTAGTTNTAATTAIIEEATIGSWSGSNTIAAPTYEIPVNLALPPNTKLLMTFATSTGGAATGFNPLVKAVSY